MIDRADILELFLRQHGVASGRQLRELGVAWSTIRRAQSKGAIVEIVPLVYRLASSPETFWARAMAVQLQSAPHGYLAAFTAGKIYGIWEMRESPMYRGVLRLPAPNRVSAHQRTPLPTWVRPMDSCWRMESQIRVVHGFRVEVPEAMLMSIAARTNRHSFERVAEKAWHLKLLTPASADAFVQAQRGSGRAGVLRVLEWVEAAKGRTRAMQSNFEVDVLAELRRVGLPEPKKQHLLVLPNGEPVHLDLAWPEAQLAVEPGHSRWHDLDPLKAEADAARDAACRSIGWETERFNETVRPQLREVCRSIARTYRERVAQISDGSRYVS